MAVISCGYQQKITIRPSPSANSLALKHFVWMLQFGWDEVIQLVPLPMQS